MVIHFISAAMPAKSNPVAKLPSVKRETPVGPLKMTP
jgi:hypothetical protein